MPDLIRDRLQTALRANYTLTRELGGGGMSRVYVAHEEALGREVVVKLLAPELAEGLSAERFTREIRLAAALQEPHIVPVLTAGTTAEGLPWYTMPFVAGESLRVRLAPGALPRDEAVGILRDVLAALEYAHARGIVHRDIKPENVLLSGRTAVVTDFGIAKALQAAKTQAPDGRADAGMLTQVGISLGTPAYMAPEQAAGDPATDHRADLYAWGVVAYELLAGRHPFAGRTSPQALVAAHFAETPPPLPGSVPPALAALVLQCLAKVPDERPESAAAVLAALDAARDDAVEARGRAAALAGALPTRAVLLRALAVYVLILALVVIGTPRLMDALGLPDWVLPGALALVALGLPLLLVALWVRHQAHAHSAVPDAALSRTATFAVQARPHLRLRRLAWSGAAAFGVFALLVAGWMALRALGIGPAGSLFAAGTLARSDTLLVADFAVTGPDTALGAVVAEAVRADLGQSHAISVAPVSRVVAALRRMERDPLLRVDERLAREVAEREGMKAVVAGDLTSVGGGYFITLRLVSAATGDVLASFQEAADAPSALIPTIQRLTRELRGKVGESLTAVRGDPPLAQVTTASLPALRKYTAANHAINLKIDDAKAAALYREAIALDSTFAGAYRGLAAALSNLQIDPVGRDSAFARAYRYRDRLAERERLFTTALYFHLGPGQDRRQAAAAYEALLALDSTRAGTLNNYGIVLTHLREFPGAEAAFRRALALDTASSNYAFNLVNPLLAQGRYAAAESTLTAAQARWPEVEWLDAQAMTSAVEARTLDSAAARAERLLARGSDPALRADAAGFLAIVALQRGQPGEAERRLAERRTLLRAAGDPDAPLTDALALARVDLWTRQTPDRAVARLDAAIAAHPVTASSSHEARQAALGAAAVYAAAGAPAKARTVLADVEAATDSAGRRRLVPERTRARAELALAEGNGADAVRLFRASDVGGDGGPATVCATCLLPDLARAAERAGWADSARVFWTRYAEEPALDRYFADQWHLARAYRRLGELWAEAGDLAKATAYDERYLALRAAAEPALQAEEETVRQRLRSRPRLAPAGEGSPPR